MSWSLQVVVFVLSAPGVVALSRQLRDDRARFLAAPVTTPVPAQRLLRSGREVLERLLGTWLGRALVLYVAVQLLEVLL